MAKLKKQWLTPKWLEIKAMYEEGTNGSKKYGTNFPVDGELNELSDKFVELLGELTRRLGWGCVIEEVHMDLWKERIWSVIENAGLLPEIAWRDAKSLALILTAVALVNTIKNLYSLMAFYLKKLFN